jgi:hypothetical protein
MIVCETMYFLLEYFKSMALWWMFLEGLYLHNQLALDRTVFDTDPRLWPYLLAGYGMPLTIKLKIEKYFYLGIPLVHTFVWLIIIFVKKQGKVERCLGI